MKTGPKYYPVKYQTLQYRINSKANQSPLIILVVKNLQRINKYNLDLVVTFMTYSKFKIFQNFVIKFGPQISTQSTK